MSERTISSGKDIVVTWPKSRAFGSYMAQLALAERDCLYINYRVHRPPRPMPERCYRVHDGLIRGWTNVIDVLYREGATVRRVADDPLAGFWPAGWYVVCFPVWHELPAPHVQMPGFRGWRWLLHRERP